nr:uncharacterized protein LOC115104828 [Oncorhynchus nerka]
MSELTASSMPERQSPCIPEATSTPLFKRSRLVSLHEASRSVRWVPAPSELPVFHARLSYYPSAQRRLSHPSAPAPPCAQSAQRRLSYQSASPPPSPSLPSVASPAPAPPVLTSAHATQSCPSAAVCPRRHAPSRPESPSLAQRRQSAQRRLTHPSAIRRSAASAPSKGASSQERLGCRLLKRSWSPAPEVWSSAGVPTSASTRYPVRLCSPERPATIPVQSFGDSTQFRASGDDSTQPDAFRRTVPQSRASG